jgi:L-ribulose-5-phosphate 3-epimerase
MAERLTRRAMLAASAVAGFGFADRGWAAEPRFKTKLRKALIVNEIDEKILLEYKEAGFEGVEVRKWDLSPADAGKARAVADRCGMRIHSVMRASVGFNDPEKRDADIESVRAVLSVAKAYGSGAILLVPSRLKGPAMPQPWGFDIEFDENTGHVTRVVEGDNGPYAEYIEAQNLATDMSREALKQLAPAAEKTGVVIGVENVWNNLWIDPKLAAHSVRSVDSPFVQFYFDVANHMKFGPPEPWIRALGDLIVRVHIKDYLLEPGGHAGKFVDIREGSIDWPSVRKELDKIGYNGWVTIEGSGKLSLAERNERLDLIVAGK